MWYNKPHIYAVYIPSKKKHSNKKECWINCVNTEKQISSTSSKEKLLLSRENNFNNL